MAWGKKKWGKRRPFGGSNMVAGVPTGIGIEAWFDGGCDPNPGGDASSSCLVLRDGVEVFRSSRYLGKGPGQSNNASEHIAAGMAIEWIASNRIEGEPATVFGDSSMIVNQLAGKWKAYSGDYLEHYRMTMSILRLIPLMEFKWLPRDQNQECDAMCTLEIEEARLSREREV